MLSRELIDYKIIKVWNWRYYGKCRDKQRKVWVFYTNSKSQFEELSKGKAVKGMTMIEGFKNPNYEVVKKLKEGTYV